MTRPIALLALLGTITLASVSQGAEIAEIPYQVPAALADAVEIPSPAQVRMGGWLGQRVLDNERNRLKEVDLEPLLAGFREKPGAHPWIGEHIGKWLHAATLAWAYTGDAELRAKLDFAARELAAAQEADGYLGTYVPGQRFGLYRGADWDVWSHKYNLIGLLTYYHYTGSPQALAACRKMGDLLLRTFPEQKSIIAAGTHVGMAATSVLEPMVVLYRTTGDERYLEFCRYLVRAWDEENGPKIAATLLAEKRVDKTANGKAYEMLSNLVGVCELARATGDRSLLEPVLIAWDDIVARRLYVTGSTSYGEHFHDDYDLPNRPEAHVGETCVTVTWIQLNSQLLRLTGEARFGNELEKAWLNHLAAAQRPDGAQWCYYTALEGTKPYGPGISCCVSSGPRGMALVPQHACLVRPAHAGRPAALIVNLFGPWRFSGTLAGQKVRLEQKGDFPRSGELELLPGPDGPAEFALLVRAPDWARPMTLTVNGQPVSAPIEEGWATIPPRTWQKGDRVTVQLHLAGRLVEGEHTNAGLAAVAWGPLVLAYDAGCNPGGPPPATVALADAGDRAPVRLLPDSAALLFEADVRSARRPEPHPARFVPFADAGADGSRYQVWLAGPGSQPPQPDSLAAFMPESRSRQGNVAGSIADTDPTTFVVTFDGEPAESDWFAVALERPAPVRRVTFAHGKTFHDGGWFDASAGKPEVQVQRTAGAEWETVGRLDDYPATTARDSAGIRSGQAFTLSLAEPVVAAAVRVVGHPASGDNPRQGFSSCAELKVYGE